MAEIPSGLVGYFQGALELVGRNPFAGFAHQVDGREPLGKRQVRIMEDCPGGNGELVPA